MENKSNAFLAGVFTLSLAVLVVFAIFWFSSDHTVRVPYDLVTRSTVNGLGPQADVKYRGLDVGKVVSIKFDPEVPGQIIVRISVDHSTPITRSTYATLGLQGVTGIAYVQLDDTAAQAGAGTPSERLPSSAKSVARIPMRAGFFEELEKRGDSLLTQLESVMGSIDGMFQTDNRRELMDTIRSVHAAAEDYSRLAKTMQPAAQDLPQIAENLNATLVASRRLAEQLASPNGQLLRTVDKVGHDVQAVSESLQGAAGDVSQNTLPQIGGLTRDARQAVRSIDRAATQFNDSPRSVLFGAPPPAPGPGEPGFQAP